LQELPTEASEWWSGPAQWRAGAAYKDLGLVIIDEEQRFGTKDKDKLRGLGAPHALALTATPIPRTLQSALVGLQPMSVLATPPARRQPIRTEVGTYGPQLLRTALLRERSRGGQSFVVVPRIEDMAPLADELRELVPELGIAEAHGKLPAAEIDEAMVGFAAGRAMSCSPPLSSRPVSTFHARTPWWS
jgi:transcription-repair coupling factor (superfamily II helicase)